MTQTVLILGANGRFGTNAAVAFDKAGWTVRRFDRNADTLETAARGVDVIANAWNPVYSKWKSQVLGMQAGIHKAALANDATVIIPGNVYVFDPETPAPWSHTSKYAARNDLCRIRIEMERGYKDAGVRTIVLRGGDYLDTVPSGNWFDKVITTKLGKGVLTYPGNPNIPRAWAYLPDIARAAVLLADKRGDLARFEDVCFPGYTLSGQQMGDTLAAARGMDVRLKQMAWWPLRLIQPFWSEVPHFFDMRYLWNTAHSLDGTKFDRLLPGFKHTPQIEAFKTATAHIPVPHPSRKLATA